MRAPHGLTYKHLVSILHYNRETGIFTRLLGNYDFPNQTRWAGTIAGSLTHKGYIEIKIDGKLYGAHQLAWFYETRKWPEKHIDHINGIPSDNRISNLRQVTRSENRANSVLNSNNTSGYKGVTFYSPTNTWHAAIMVRGKKISLRYHATPEDAAEAYNAALKKYFGEIASRALLLNSPSKRHAKEP